MTDTSTVKLYAPKEPETREFGGQSQAYKQFAEMLEAERPRIAAGTRLNTPQVRSR